tara:strand:+ start:200 stop:1162 length:963 start_codon:yes stop_codon:yes gene_type:complete
MYLSKKNNFFHGIMFHHFHDDLKHKKSQGSMSKEDLYKLVKFIGRKNILDANDFFIRFKEGKLNKQNVCFTFDDGIKSQIDIALPVLEDLQIKSFFFVYSSIFQDKPDYLEIYRYFRTNYFKNMDEFYEIFFKNCKMNLKNIFIKNKKTLKDLKIKFPMYSINDIKFRFVRDRILKKNEYRDIMLDMFKKKKFNPSHYLDILFMNEKDLIRINKLGHLIGLHSHTHPTLLEKLNYKKQFNEYNSNLKTISKILDCKKNKIKYMSHPCGSYNSNTFNILKKLNIELGFKQIMKIDKNMKKINNSNYEIARQNHSEIMRAIK